MTKVEKSQDLSPEQYTKMNRDWNKLCDDMQKQYLEQLRRRDRAFIILFWSCALSVLLNMFQLFTRFI